MVGLPVETVCNGGISLSKVKSMSKNVSDAASNSWLTHRYSILPAFDGILHLEVLDHSFTGEDFHSFIEGVLD